MSWLNQPHVYYVAHLLSLTSLSLVADSASASVFVALTVLLTSFYVGMTKEDAGVDEVEHLLTFFLFNTVFFLLRYFCNVGIYGMCSFLLE